MRARSLVSASRAPSPTRIQRSSAACATVTWLKVVRASPLASSAPSAPPSTSCAMPSPSNTPTAIVSAPLSAGLDVVALTFMAPTL